MNLLQCHRCRKNGETSYYKYVETREGGYNGAFSPLVKGHYHFYKCKCGARFAESSKKEVRS